MPDIMAPDTAATRRAVLIATPTHDGRLHHSYVAALIVTRALFAAQGISSDHLFLPGWSLIPEARNEITVRFLADPSWPHLLMVDSDIVWRSADVLRLLGHGHELVCGIYARKSAADPALLFWRVEAGAGPLPRCPQPGCLEIAATGAGFMLVRRSVFRRLIESGTTLPVHTALGLSIKLRSLVQEWIEDPNIERALTYREPFIGDMLPD
jgi:hypothetical protein